VGPPNIPASASSRWTGGYGTTGDRRRWNVAPRLHPRYQGRHTNGASVLAYFFGRELHQKLGIPIGLINTSVGGTPAEAWTSRKALEANPTLKPLAGQANSSTCTTP